MKKIPAIFLTAFVLNVLWENAHAFLYADYQGGVITEYILLRASSFDAVMISVLLLPFIYVPALRRREYLIVLLGTALAVINEWYGLSTARWHYNELMPIVPFLNTGLTPTLQLGLLGYATYKLTQQYFRRCA